MIKTQCKHYPATHCNDITCPKCYHQLAGNCPVCLNRLSACTCRSLPREGETTVNEKGAKQSFIEADFSCIPPIVLKLLAQCLGFGRRKYGFENWKGIPLEDNLSHAMNHINEWRMGDRTEPHLVNAIARLTFALWHAVDTGQQPARYIHPDTLPSPEKKVPPVLLDEIVEL